MKKIIITAIAAIALTQIVNAQDTNTLSVDKQPGTAFYKHEIAISYGVLPIMFTTPPEGESTHSILRNITINFGYSYNFNEKHAITASITYRNDLMDNEFMNNDFYFSIAPEIGYKYNYLMNNYFTIYLSFSFGAEFIHFNNHHPFISHGGFAWSPAYQISPFCVSIGKAHNFDFGVGLGNQGHCKIGYKYKF